MEFIGAPMREKLRLVYRVIRAPQLTIRCFGGEDAREIWRYFSSRHPKLPLVRRKSFGASLRQIPEDKEGLMEGSQFTLMRRKVRKAQKMGYMFRKIDPSTYFDDIMRINLSSSIRQGSTMTDDYVDPEIVKLELTKPGDWFGIFSADDRIEAYAHVPIFGDTFVYWKILGNASLLDDGIVYLLVFETLSEMVDRAKRQGFPRWAMYDMYIGGPDGLREFKRRTGFHPHRVKWQWVDR